MRSYKIKFGTLVEVEWGDAWCNTREYYKGNDYSPLKCRTVGYVVEVRKDTIVLATSRQVDSQATPSYRDMQVIPWSWVLFIWTING